MDETIQAPKIIFIHGYESSGHGFKGYFLRSIFPNMLTPDFTGELLERMEQLKNVLKTEKKWIFIGSSFGGLMGTLYMMEYPDKVEKAVLMAPALVSPLIPEDFKLNKIEIPVIIFHGKNDEVVPLDPVRKFAEDYFKKCEYYLVDDDHRMHATTKSIEWKKILKI